MTRREEGKGDEEIVENKGREKVRQGTTGKKEKKGKK